ncbi:MULTISPECIES: hypothetical protein [unclassified Bradyrhizobium]|uniref:hypothetical protein n=1 Tax=unclassified Bradyrhizobium TaxID=2631580 RepID=UPI002915FC01|nr:MULTISPECIES: hypothetical protein [unclassified Bradyrhizobium]
MLGHRSNFGDDSRREIKSILQSAKLEHPINKAQFAELTEIHSSFRRAQAALSKSLEEGRISPEQYLVHFKSLLQESMTRNERVLGHQNFVSVFGEAGLEPTGIVNDDTFYTEVGSGPSTLRAR